MIRIEQYDDVTRVRLASAGSRLAGLDVSCYIVRGVLVDSGFPRARGAIGRLLTERSIAGAMLTHYHEDHAGNAELLAAHGIPLAMHAETVTALRRPLPIRLYRRVVWGTPIALRTAPRPFAHDVLQFVPTPGHSADHQAVWDPERRTLFSGDLWLGVRARVMHVSEDPHTIATSLRAAIALAPRRLFDAHRGQIENAGDALTAKLTWLEDAIAAIEAKLGAGWSDRAIVREVLGGEERVAVASGYEYAVVNFVKAVRRAGRGARG